MLKRQNKACQYFPCHEQLDDCTFCYCPFYPCGDENLGRLVYSEKLKKDYWSCRDCSWIHKRKVADSIFALIKRNEHKIKYKNLLFPLEPEAQGSKTGIIILAHGSRLKKANQVLRNIVKLIERKLPGCPLVPAYLQFSSPGLEESIEHLVKESCVKIIIVPFFLFNGNHVRRDIPEIIEKAREKHLQVKFVYAKNLSKDTRVVDIIIDRIMEAMADEISCQPERNRG